MQALRMYRCVNQLCWGFVAAPAQIDSISLKPEFRPASRSYAAHKNAFRKSEKVPGMSWFDVKTLAFYCKSSSDDWSAPGNQVNQHHNECDHKQQMDQRSGYMEPPS